MIPRELSHEKSIRWNMFPHKNESRTNLGYGARPSRKRFSEIIETLTNHGSGPSISNPSYIYHNVFGTHEWSMIRGNKKQISSHFVLEPAVQSARGR